MAVACRRESCYIGAGDNAGPVFFWREASLIGKVRHEKEQADRG